MRLCFKPCMSVVHTNLLGDSNEIQFTPYNQVFKETVMMKGSMFCLGWQSDQVVDFRECLLVQGTLLCCFDMYTMHYFGQSFARSLRLAYAYKQ